MAAFSSSVATICADYFGDELGLPLPELITAKKMNNKTGAVAEPVEARNLTVAAALNKKKENVCNANASEVLVEFPKRVALAFTPVIHGFQPFETVLFD